MAFTNDQKAINLQNKAASSTLHDLSLDKKGSYYLADNPKFFEPQRGNSFKFYVSGLKDLLKVPSNVWAQNNADEVLELSVKSSSVPHFNITTISINRGNSTMKFAGKAEFSDGKLTLNDYIGAGTKDILLAWQKQAYDVRTEKIGLASDYKLDAYLLEYTPEYQLVRTWVLKGCWISGISESDYDHDTTENKTLDATIVYDKAYIDETSV